MPTIPPNKHNSPSSTTPTNKEQDTGEEDTNTKLTIPSTKSLTKHNHTIYSPTTKQTHIQQQNHKNQNTTTTNPKVFTKSSHTPPTTDTKENTPPHPHTPQHLITIYTTQQPNIKERNNVRPYSSLNSIEFKTGIFFGEIEAFSAGDSVAYNWVDRFSGRKFVKLVRQLSADAKRNHNMNMWNQAQQGDPTVPVHTQPEQPRLSAEEERTLAITNQLKQLKELLDAGIISPEEYNSKRQLLVNSL